jgi:signal transduction histidine kinase
VSDGAESRPGFRLEELRRLELLQGLPDDQLQWLCEHGERVELAESEHMFEHGQPADAMWIVVDGVVRGFEEHGGQLLPVATTSRGDVTGMLPFSRMTHYPRYTVATEPATVLRLDAGLFREMLGVSEEIGRRLVARMSDRVRGDVRLEQQSEKMMALGRLSAGLAHELNNPAAAISSAAARLDRQREMLPGLVAALSARRLDSETMERLKSIRAVGREGQDPGLSPLDRSDLEEEVAAWLDLKGVSDAWDIARTFVDAGLEVDDLAEAVRDVSPEAVGDALAWVGGGIEADRLVQDIQSSAARISELVASIKVYSHMDRSAEHKPTDVRVGVDNTLIMLAHKVRDKAISLLRDMEEDLPPVAANAGELNQVWTNLIDNAIDAVDEGGHIVVRARCSDHWLEVGIEDDGPGIPEELRARIFEPFFTTKEIGIGTGLGLGIADRIVKLHGGHIEVRTRPGKTVVCVRLPVPVRG